MTRQRAASRLIGAVLVTLIGSAAAPAARAEGPVGANVPDVRAEDPVGSNVGDVSVDDDYLDELDELGGGDPLEPSNRVVFGGNEAIYLYLFDPLATAYAFVFPKPVRHAVLQFFDNLGEPAACLNELLQLNPVRAGRTTARFLVNTTVGVGGLFDPAARIGLPKNHTDFGETLGVYGVGDGWYLVVPVVGPSSVRDLFGDVVNGFMHPQSYFLAYFPQAILATSGGFSRYEASREDLDNLRQGSVDFYSAMRGAYLMQRAAEVREAREDSPVLRDHTPDVATSLSAEPSR